MYRESSIGRGNRKIFLGVFAACGENPLFLVGTATKQKGRGTKARSESYKGGRKDQKKGPSILYLAAKGLAGSRNVTFL